MENFDLSIHHPEANNEDDDRERREEQYKKAIESEHHYEIRETIDIFETPLLFRADTSILQFLEIERRGDIREKKITEENIKGRSHIPDIQKEESMIFMELPLPFYTSGDNTFPLHKQEIIDLIKKDDETYFSDPDVKASFEEMADMWVEQFPNLDKDSIVDILYKTTWFAYSGLRKESSARGGYSEDDIHERQKFLHDVLNNEEYRKIWLAGQKMDLGKDIPEKIKEELRHHENLYGLNSPPFMKKGTFLLDPKVINLSTVPASQEHGDFSFEVTAIKNIPVEDIVGYLEYSQEDHSETISNLLKLALKNEESEYGGLFTNFFLSNQGRTYGNVKESILHRYDLIESYKKSLTEDNLNEDIRESYKKSLEKHSEEMSYVLGCELSDASRERVEDIIKTDKNLYKRFCNIRPDLFNPQELDGLTLQEVDTQIRRIDVEALKNLFPYQNFSVNDSLLDFATKIMNGLEKYIEDRFKVDPKRVTKKEFVEIIIKRLGIPIYNIQGDQLWPEKMTHDKIAGHKNKNV